MCRLENQRNQRFSRFFMNFRSFDFNCLDSNNLSTLWEFDDLFAWSALNIRECEVFAWWEHDDQFALEFRDWWSELRDDVEENNYLTTLFFHLHHYCLSIWLRWRDYKNNHEMLCKDVDDNDNEKNSECENDSENDDEDDNEETQNWFWWFEFWWCWFCECSIEKSEWVRFLKNDWRDSVLKIVLKREMFISFYIAESKMNLRKLKTEHDDEFDRRLLDWIKRSVVDFRRFRLLHLLLTRATILVSSFMRFFTYCAFCSDDKHLTNAFLMFWFFASIALKKWKTLIFDVIISSAIVALLDFAVTKKSFANVNFFVSDEISLNDCVDRFDEDEFQHNADLFIFVENDFLQSSHVNNFFRSQFEHSRDICINQRFNDDRHVAIVMKNENVDFDRMY
jgi:hypothetical protein